MQKEIIELRIDDDELLERAAQLITDGKVDFMDKSGIRAALLDTDEEGEVEFLHKGDIFGFISVFSGLLKVEVTKQVVAQILERSEKPEKEFDLHQFMEPSNTKH